MTQLGLIQPPAVAAWLVSLFCPAEEAESILGDLAEEFLGLAAASGAAIARKWYWRQTVRTIGHLGATAYTLAPWSTVLAVVVGYLLVRFAPPLLPIEGILNRHRVYESHPGMYLLWFTWGGFVLRLIKLTLTGALMAIGAKGRELAATMTLAFVEMFLWMFAFFFHLARTGRPSLLMTLPYVFGSCVALVLGGGIVRTRRSPAPKSVLAP